MSRALSPAKQALLQALSRGAATLAGRKEPSLSRRPPGERVPLSLQQERIWEVERDTPQLATYMNLYMIIRFRGALDPQILEASLLEVARRQESFRTRIAVENGVPSPEVMTEPQTRLSVTELCAGSPEEGEQEAIRQAHSEGRRPYDVRNGPLVRPHLYRLSPKHHVLLLGVHHIVFDAWSGAIVLSELAAHYNALRSRQVARLSGMQLAYTDYAYWQRQWYAGEAIARQKEFWRRHLAAGVPLATLPGAKCAPEEAQPDGHVIRVALEASLISQVRTLSRSLNVTPFVTFVSAFAALLAKRTGQARIMICVPVSGRHLSGVEDIVGYFVNALPLCFDLQPELDFETLIQRTKASSFAAYAHQDIQMEHFAELAPGGQLPWQFLLQLQHFPAAMADLGDVVFEPIELSYGRDRLDLSIDLIETDVLTGAGDGIVGFVNYNRSLYDEIKIREFWGDYLSLLERIAQQKQLLLADI